MSEVLTQEHYTDGRRYSYISNTWILLSSWNDKEEIASLREQLIASLAAAGNMVQGLRAQLQAQTERADELDKLTTMQDGGIRGLHEQIADLTAQLEARTRQSTINMFSLSEANQRVYELNRQLAAPVEAWAKEVKPLLEYLLPFAISWLRENSDSESVMPQEILEAQRLLANWPVKEG